jgi:hypothetical protein
MPKLTERDGDGPGPKRRNWDTRVAASRQAAATRGRLRLDAIRAVARVDKVMTGPIGKPVNQVHNRTRRLGRWMNPSGAGGELGSTLSCVRRIPQDCAWPVIRIDDPEQRRIFCPMTIPARPSGLRS